MDRNLDIDNFERLLRDRSEDFKMYPTKRVWHSIYNNIHPGKKWPSIATCIILISILLLIGFLNTNDAITSTSALAKNKNSVSINSTSQTIEIYPLKQSIDLSNFLTATSLTGTSSFYLKNQPADINDIYKNSFNFNFLDIIDFIKNEKDISKLNSNKNLLANNYRNNKMGSPQVQIPSATNGRNILAGKAILFNNKNLRGNNVKINEPLNFLSFNVLIPTAGKQLPQNSITLNIPLTENIFTAIIENDATDLSDNKIKIADNDLINLEDAGPTQKTQLNKKDLTNIAGNINKLSIKENAYQPLILTDADKAWIEDYAQYNRPIPKKWAGKLGWQLYITPSVVYRTLKNNLPNEQDINKQVVEHPSMGLEIGTALIYPIFKGVKFKTGLQLNFTRYNTEGYENSHPVSTSIILNDAPGQYYESSRTTPYSNYGGISPTNLHNDTYQISIPIGLEFKLAGNDNLQWNIAASIQPSYVFGGQSYLISSDKRNFIKEKSFLNRWNLNAGFETFLSYKVNGFTLQFGPQLRQQIFTTNSKVYTIQEKLTNYGFRFGITKLLK